MKQLITVFLVLVCFSVEAYNLSQFDDSSLQDTHKVVLQGNYLEQDTRAEAETFSYSLKYDGSYLFSFLSSEWPEFEVFLRPWLVSSSTDQLSDSFSAGQQYDGQYFEAREFYVRDNRFLNMPSLTFSVGRQQYSDYYGIWWDDSIESLKLDFNKTLYGGFIALGQQFFNYNTDTNELNNNQKDVSYLFGEGWWLIGPSQRHGVRIFGQLDHSVEQDLEISDFTGVKLGYFIESSTALNQDHLLSFYGDLSLITGQNENINSGSTYINAEESVNGWSFVSELYDQFLLQEQQLRLGIRFGITDSADTPFSGHTLSAIQSDRVSKPGQYSTGLSGTMINSNLSNVRFVGLMAELKLDARSHIEVLAFDIKKRNSDLNLAVSISDGYDDGKGASIGQSYEVFYFWEMFPVNVEGRELGVDLLVSAGIFNGGSAIEGSPDDYRVSVAINAAF